MFLLNNVENERKLKSAKIDIKKGTQKEVRKEKEKDGREMREKRENRQ